MMKINEPEAYLNPFQAAMFAGDNHWQLDRHKRDVSAREFSLPLDRSAWLEGVYETQTQEVASALLEAVSDYSDRNTVGLGVGEESDNYDRGQNAFTRVIERLRQLNRQLTIKAGIAQKARPGDKLIEFEKTAFYAVSFARAVNISIPIDCVDLRRWYTALRKSRGI